MPRILGATIRAQGRSRAYYFALQPHHDERADSRDDDENRAQFTKGYESLGKAGERVLGFALKPLDAEKFPKDFQFDDEEPFNGITDSKDMVFVGLMALIDPPH